MNIFERFKQYKLNKQNFVVTYKKVDVSYVGADGKKVNKTEKRCVLNEIKPTAIVNRSLTIPSFVDEISFNAIANLPNKSQINTVVLPSGLKSVEIKSYVYPFATLTNLSNVVIDDSQNQGNFFTINGSLYRITDSRLVNNSAPDDKRDLIYLRPYDVELVYAGCKNYEVPNVAPVSTAKNISINNGAFAQNRNSTISVTLKPYQTIHLNNKKDETYSYNYPEKIIVDGKHHLSAASFLLQGGRMLTEISKTKDSKLLVTHINAADEVMKFVDPDPITNPIAQWELGRGLK